MNRSAPIFRSLIAALAMLAWFVASNHCSFAASFETAPQPSECPMHTSAKHLPVKKSGADFLCCKNLPATAALAAKAIAKPIYIAAPPELFAALVLEIEDGSRENAIVCDTGPPGANNFAESVLQRSILAHAPPFLA